MSEGFLHCAVSIDCGDVLGTYQGRVSSIDKNAQTLSITKAYRNGKRCDVPRITICARDIKDVKILMTADEVRKLPDVKPLALTNKQDSVPAPALPPTPAKGLVKNSTSKPSSQTQPNNRQQLQTTSSNGYDTKRLSPQVYQNDTKTNGYHSHKPNKGAGGDNALTNGFGHHTYSSPQITPIKDDNDFRRRTNSASDYHDRRKATTPRKMEAQQPQQQQRRQRQQRDNAFSAPAETCLDEFDFEKNLAMFDKRAVFEEIEKEMEEAGIEMVVKPQNKKQPAKYRCDENVLNSAPVIYKQIKVPSQTSKEFVTDSGLVVPSVSLELRDRILDAASQAGLSEERQLEMIGRSTCEMVLQLLGGGHRLTPKNAHQKPSVVVLCGPHLQGAYGLNCARQLSAHGVNVTVYVPNYKKMLPALHTELQLFDLTKGKRTAFAKDLPSSPVDMILSAVDSHEGNLTLQGQQWFQDIVAWGNQCKAPALALDPPIQGSTVEAKWCMQLCLPLPLAETCGKMYLCDLGIPQNILKQLGIKYQSPFAHKFCVALNPSS